LIGTWNVQGLSGKAEDVTKGLLEMKIDIAALSETEKKGNGMEMLANYIHMYGGVYKSKRASKGMTLPEPVKPEVGTEDLY